MIPYLHQSQSVVLQRLVESEVLQRRVLEDGEEHLRGRVRLEELQEGPRPNLLHVLLEQVERATDDDLKDE